uniref:zinc finger and BTB domain-containing protein 22-like n=1 Tax=Nyctereutes procyonoides TaxID=34880 RepID=UPI0024445C1E|nr:zinc finger and BTB domain-containing protein 22-like [Nyctereutes procyonoides]
MTRPKIKSWMPHQLNHPSSGGKPGPSGPTGLGLPKNSSPRGGGFAARGEASGARHPLPLKKQPPAAGVGSTWAPPATVPATETDVLGFGGGQERHRVFSLLG